MIVPITSTYVPKCRQSVHIIIYNIIPRQSVQIKYKYISNIIPNNILYPI